MEVIEDDYEVIVVAIRLVVIVMMTYHYEKKNGLTMAVPMSLILKQLPWLVGQLKHLLIINYIELVAKGITLLTSSSGDDNTLPSVESFSAAAGVAAAAPVFNFLFVFFCCASL